MHDQLASVNETVALPPKEELSVVQCVLSSQGYKTLRRADYSLTAERHLLGGGERQNTLNLTVMVHPQTGASGG